MRMDGFVFYRGLSKIFLFLQREMIALLSIRKKKCKKVDGENFSISAIFSKYAGLF